MKYKVVFDTEAVWNESEHMALDQVLNGNIVEMLKFLNENKVKGVTLCLPELVLEERIQQRKEIVEKTISKLNDIATRVRPLGYRIRKVPFKNPKTLLRKKTLLFLEENGVEIIKLPKLNGKKLLDRALNKVKPFNDKTSGFKDTVIYFSVVEDAKRTDNTTYIFVSGNHKDFTGEVVEDFCALTGKQLILVKSLDDLKETLDKLLLLRLELEKLHKEVREGILKKSGTIMAELNKAIGEQDSSSMTYSMAGVIPQVRYNTSSMYDPFKDNHKTHYDFSGIEISNISTMSSSIYFVEGYLKVIDASKDGANVSYADYKMFGRVEENFRFTLNYNISSGDVRNITFENEVRYVL